MPAVSGRPGGLRSRSRQPYGGTVAAEVGVTFVTRGILERNPRPDVVGRPCASDLTPQPLTNYLIWRHDETSRIVHHFVAVGKSLFDRQDSHRLIRPLEYCRG